LFDIQNLEIVIKFFFRAGYTENIG
jgi:hypothetical protein